MLQEGKKRQLLTRRRSKQLKKFLPNLSWSTHKLKYMQIMERLQLPECLRDLVHYPRATSLLDNSKEWRPSVGSIYGIQSLSGEERASLPMPAWLAVLSVVQICMPIRMVIKS